MTGIADYLDNVQVFNVTSSRLVFRGWSACDFIDDFFEPVSITEASWVHKTRNYLAGPETPKDCFVGTDKWAVFLVGQEWMAHVDDNKYFVTATIPGLAKVLGWVTRTSTTCEQEVNELLVKARETVAAVTIQSAWKGWKVRMKYRFDPRNSLGRHIVLRDMPSLLRGV